jgi:hypothetical protein
MYHDDLRVQAFQGLCHKPLWQPWYGHCFEIVAPNQLQGLQQFEGVKLEGSILENVLAVLRAEGTI